MKKNISFQDDLLSVIDSSQRSQSLLKIAESNQRKMHKLLIRMEEKFQKLTDATSEAVAISEEGIVVNVNKKMEELTGCTQNEMIRKPLTKFFPSEYQDTVNRILQNGDENSCQVVSKNKKGKTLHLEIRGKSINLYSRNLRVTTIQDITHQKLIENELTENQEILKQILDSALDAVIMIDDKGIIKDWNPQAEIVFGWKRKEAVGKELAQAIIPRKYRAAHRKGLKYFLKTGQGPVLNKRIEITALNKKGTEFPVELAIVPVHSKNTICFSAFIRDISDRKIAEQTLKKSEERLREIVKFFPYPTAVHINQRFVYVNDAFAKLFKARSKKELLGKNVLDYVHPKFKKTARERIKQLKTKGGDIPLLREKFIGTDGKEMDVEVNAIAIQYNDQSAILATLSDVTDRIAYERDLKEREERLSKFLASTTDACFLLDKNLNLVEANKAGVILWQSKKKEIIGKHVLERSLEAKKKGRLKKYVEVLKTGKPIELFDETRLLSGESKYLHIRVFKVGEGIGTIATDLTEFRKAENALKESEEQFRSLAENAPAVIFRADKKGTILFINRKTPDFKSKVLGTSLFDYVHKDYIKIYRKNIKHVISTGENISFELQGHVQKSNIKWYSTLIAPIKGDKHNEGVVIISTDITNNKRAEEALIESEERFRRIVEDSPHPMIVHSKGLIVYLNDAAVKILEAKNAQQLIGTSVLNFIHPDYEKMAQHRIKSLLEKGGKTPVADEKLITMKGKVIDAEVAGMLMYYDGNPSILVTIRDVTDRNKFEAQLRESEERFRSLFENANDLIQSVSPDGKYNFVNRAWIKALGYTKKDLKKMNMMDIIHPDYHHHCMKLFKKVLTGTSINNIEAKFICKNGSYIDIEGNISPRIINNEVIATQGFFRDVTKRKELAQQLSIERNQRIFDVINTQEDERHRIAKEVHDSLGQMLTAISINIDNIRNDYEKTAAIKKDEFDDIQNLIRDAIDEAKDISYDLMPSVLHDLGLVPALNVLCDKIKKNSKINVQLIASNFKESANNQFNTNLYRIAQEALTNITKHSEATKAEIHLFRSKKSVFLIIEDNGKGFSLKKKRRDTMGLGNINDRVRAFNGKFKINTAPRKGTEIIVEIPLDSIS